MTHYNVSWEMNIEADNPEAAAREALRIHRDPESIATVFEVWDENGDHVKVDLEACQQPAPAIWFYLSFASTGAFLGAAFVQADGPRGALDRATLTGCNPGGEVMIIELERLPPGHRADVLLSRADLEAVEGTDAIMQGSVDELEEMIGWRS